MQYAEELKELLRPLGVYDVDRGAGAAELETVGTALDGIFTKLEAAGTEALPLTATGTGLGMWEDLMPYVPASQSVEDRRRAIIALLRIDGSAFTADMLNATISGCGIRAVVEETGESQTVQVIFPGVRGEPENFTELCSRIEQILPCHLKVDYLLVYLQWWELESLFATWGALDASGKTWGALEKMGAESA